MRLHRDFGFRILGVVVFGSVLAVLSNETYAGIFSRQESLPPKVEAAAPGGVTGGTHCCPQYCVSYWHHPTLCRICCGCCKWENVVLQVTDPCCCDCTVEVPVCIPGCCTGAPSVHSRCGILGRRMVTYEWCCGYRVTVVFTRSNDVVVHTFGR